MIKQTGRTLNSKFQRWVKTGLLNIFRTLRAYLLSLFRLVKEQNQLLPNEPMAGASHNGLVLHRPLEAAQRESEEQFRAAFDIPSVGMFQAEPYSGRFLRVNRYFCELTGYSEGELINRPFTEIIHPDDRALIREQFLSLRQREISEIHVETRYIRKDGGICWGDVTMNLMRALDGHPLRALAVVQDITDHKRVEEALRESEARIAGIIISAMDAIISVDNQHRIVLFNLAAERMFGYTSAEMLGQPISQLIPMPYRDTHEQHIRRFGKTGETARKMGALNAVSGVRRNGEEFPIEASISQMKTNGQQFFTVILRDITERTRANERLTEQATLLDQAHDAIIVRDLNNCVCYWGGGAERLYGWTADEVIGRSVAELMYREDLATLTEVTRELIEKGRWSGELNNLTKDNRKLTVEGRWTLVRDEAGRPKNILVINTNVTEKKKIESQFLRAQRMESIGALASGIAHDLNNVLAPILMAIYSLQQRFTDQDSQQWLSLIRQSAERGRDLITQVLTFARGTVGERLPVKPADWVNSTVNILKDTLPKNIVLQVSLAEDLWEVAGDATQLNQVLLNLCLNARDAMPAGGQLLIKIENLSHESLTTKTSQPLSARCVCLTVADTGVGIPNHLLDRIFEPFYTTKPSGQGTGLGLATTLGIVKSHGGWIDVASKLEEGTQFKVYLPANSVTPEESLADPVRGVIPKGHGELILLAEDEPEIREITKATLEAFGYRVLAASNGQEALALFRIHQNKILAVLTDVVMPTLDGAGLVQSLYKLSPHVRVIATSGLPFTSYFSAENQVNINAFLSKPYSAEILLSTLAEVLATTD